MSSLALKLAFRGLRGGIGGFGVFLACLILGVAAIAASGSFDASLKKALNDDSRALLGGDVELRLSYRTPSDDEIEAVSAYGAISILSEMRAMAKGADGRRTLVEVKAVDDSYPLYGQAILQPEQSLDQALRQNGYGGAVESGLLARLGLSLGQSFMLGESEIPIRAIIEKEPDRVAAIFGFGPRLMIDRRFLDQTGLIQPGSMMSTTILVRFHPGVSAEQFKQDINLRFPEAGWRIRTPDEATPGIQQFLDNLTQFMTLVGLSALLIGGIGVANGVKAFLETKIVSIATLKCLGASQRLILGIYYWEIGILAAIGIIIGLIIGALSPIAAVWLLGDALPLQAKFGLYVEPLMLAALFGVLTVIAFTAWPLAQAGQIRASLLFRDISEPTRPWPTGWAAALIIFSALGLAALAMITSPDKRLAASFIFGVIAAFLLFGALGQILMVLCRIIAKKRRKRTVAWSLALSSLYRPGAPTKTVVLSLGLGLTVLAAVAMVETNMSHQISERMPTDAPSFFFIDIQPDQIEPFQNIAAETGATISAMAPMVRGRIVRINGVFVDEVSIDQEVKWAVRGDRGLTESATIPKGARVVQGEWWPENYAGPPLVSLDAAILKGFGLKLGETITINVLGRDLTATISNTRIIDWTTLSMNFAIVFSPGTLAGAPSTYVATVHAAKGEEDRTEQIITDALPMASSIRVKEALGSAQALVRNISLAIAAAASVTLIAGVLVLTGAIAAGRKRRTFETVLMKVLGGRRSDLLLALLYEYALLGAATGLAAAILGSIAGWATLNFVLKADWIFMPLPLIGIVVASIALIMIVGVLGAMRALGTKSAPYLRNA